jgi:hypothetical protein
MAEVDGIVSKLADEQSDARPLKRTFLISHKGQAAPQSRFVYYNLQPGAEAKVCFVHHGRRTQPNFHCLDASSNDGSSLT